MHITDAQRELRSAYYGGFVGQGVAAVIWASSAALGTWVSPRAGMAALFFVSMALFPITRLVLRWMDRPARLSKDNTLDQLATQIAFTVPIGFLLVGAATLHRTSWFYPASMVIVGAHYLPFVFLYGMWQFGALAIALIAAGAVLGFRDPEVFGLGGWLGAAVLLTFAVILRGAIRKEEAVREQDAAGR